MPQIFVLEDDEPISRLIDLSLSVEGYGSRHFSRGRESLEALREGTPDLIILDVRLPDIDGASFINEARAGGYEGPILVVTALDRTDAVFTQLTSELGEDAVLHKPFDPEELVRRVGLLVRN